MSRTVDEICRAALRLKQSRPRVIVAIDGCCASGKTTLSRELSKRLDCTVIHMDDFFLPKEKATAQRLSEAGENIDHERFYETVMVPLSRGESFFLEAYDCRTKSLSPKTQIRPRGIVIVEGAYSCHPRLWDFYDLHIFLTVPPDVQLARLKERTEPERLDDFLNKWIVLEQMYFDAFDIKRRCELCFENC